MGFDIPKIPFIIYGNKLSIYPGCTTPDDCFDCFRNDYPDVEDDIFYECIRGYITKDIIQFYKGKDFSCVSSSVFDEEVLDAGHLESIISFYDKIFGGKFLVYDGLISNESGYEAFTRLYI